MAKVRATPYVSVKAGAERREPGTEIADPTVSRHQKPQGSAVRRSAVVMNPRAMAMLQRSAGNAAVAGLIGRTLPEVPPVGPASVDVPALSLPQPAAGSPVPTVPTPFPVVSPGLAPTMSSLLEPATSPIGAVASLRTAFAGLPGMLTTAARHAATAIPSGPAPTGLPRATTPPQAQVTGGPALLSDQSAPAPTPALTVPAAAAAHPGDPDPNQVGALTTTAVNQVAAVAASAGAGVARDFGVAAVAPTLTPAALPQALVPIDGSVPTGVAPEEPHLDPKVAAVLTSAYGPKMQAHFSAAVAETTAAAAGHDSAVTGAAASTHAEITAAQLSTADAQVLERTNAANAISARRTALHASNSAEMSVFQSTAGAMQAEARADISTKLTETRAAADAELAAASRPGTPGGTTGAAVQRGWFGDALSAVGDGLSAIGSAVGSAATAVVDTVSAARARVSGLMSRAAAFVSDRVRRVGTAISSAARSVASRIGAAARSAASWMNDRAKAAYSAVNSLAQKLVSAVATFAGRLRDKVAGLLSALKRGIQRIYSKVAGFVRNVISMAKAAATFVKLMADRVIDNIIEIVRDPGAVIDKLQARVEAMAATVPAKLEGVLAEHVAPLLGGGSAQQKPGGSANSIQRIPLQRQVAVQRDETADAEPPTKVSHWEGIKQALGSRLDYLATHKWEVFKDAALEVLVPGVAMYRHLPKMWEEIKAAWKSLMAGEISDVIDHGLALSRELMAIVSSIVAQASIVVFIVVSVFGTPVAGAAALGAIGLATIAVDAQLQILTILKSSGNLAAASDSRPQDDNKTDYGRVADSSIAVAFMLALIALGALASSAAKSLLTRFPALAAAVESAKARARKAVGNAPATPKVSQPKRLQDLEGGFLKDTGSTSGWAPEAKAYPIREKLTYLEQRAFDRWVQDRTSFQVEKAVSKGAPPPTPAEIEAGLQKAIGNKDVDGVRNMIRDKIEWAKQRNAEVEEAKSIRKESPLDPQLTNGPAQISGTDVWVRYNKTPPSLKEIGEATRLSKATGERIDLYGDTYPGIDGTIGGRPLQLKGVPSGGPTGAAEVADSAIGAFTKAKGNGYSRVEVSIEAPSLTKAEVQKALNGRTAPYVDGVTVQRLRIWCKDGLLEPGGLKLPVPPPHPNTPKVDAESDKDLAPTG